MKTIVVTGASGLVATELIHVLLRQDMYRIVAVTRDPKRLIAKNPDASHIECVTLENLEKTVTSQDILAVVNCAFARNSGPAALAESLQYLQRLLQITLRVKPKLFINISSQSVYGKDKKPLWTEDMPPAPDYLYAMGKYASELIVETALAGTSISYTNLRLASVCENARFLNVFARNALQGGKISVQGGSQNLSFIDVRDVASALLRVLDGADGIELRSCYNVGTGSQRTIAELAYDVKRLADEKYGACAEVVIVPADIVMDVGMDPTLFCETFGWHALYGWAEMIISLLELCWGGVLMPYSFKVRYLTR